MEIEYLKIFQEIEGDKTDIHNWKKLSRKKLTRGDLIKKFSFAVPSEEAITGIIKYSPIIEIGAGNGYWAYLIDKFGGKIEAFDNFSRDKEWGKNEDYKLDSYFIKKWFDVKQGDEKIIDKYPNHTLFLCWIEYCGVYGYKALKRYKGKYFIHIGEGRGGCTGEDDFFDYLDTHFKEIENFYIPHWFGFHDYCDVYERI
jgi:hypothetical protein